MQTFTYYLARFYNKNNCFGLKFIIVYVHYVTYSAKTKWLKKSENKSIVVNFDYRSVSACLQDSVDTTFQPNSLCAAPNSHRMDLKATRGD